MRTFAKIISVATVVVAAGTLVSCAKKSGDSSQSGSGSQKARVIIIASSSAPNPWIVVDDNGKSGGYDIDIIRLVFEQLPQYEARFTVTEFASIFTGLDSGMYQLGVNHLGYNRARGEKYLFSYPYDYGAHGIFVRKDSDIKSVFDFGGHSTVTSVASFNSDTFENWNSAHPDNPIKVQYSDTEAEYALQISNGTLDFYYFTKYSLDEKLRTSGLTDCVVLNVPLVDNIKFTNKEGLPEGQYYIFPKGEEQLQKDFDEVLLRLVEDGTIHRLREQYFGIPLEEDAITVDFLTTNKSYVEADLARQGE